LGSTHLSREGSWVDLESSSGDTNGDITFEVTRSWLDADGILGVSTSGDRDLVGRELKKILASWDGQDWESIEELSRRVTETTSSHLTNGEDDRTEVHGSSTGGTLSSWYTGEDKLIRLGLSELGGVRSELEDNGATRKLDNGTLDSSLCGLSSSSSTSSGHELERSGGGTGTIHPSRDTTPLVWKSHGDEVTGSSNSVGSGWKSEGSSDISGRSQVGA
jgi:hypothetical protein